MPDQWMAVVDGRRTGPFTLKQLRDMARLGRLNPSDQVSDDGGRTWKPACLCKGVFPRSQPVEVAPPKSRSEAYRAAPPAESAASTPRAAPPAPPVPAPGPSHAGETLVWSGSPSQWINVGTYLLCGLFCWLVVPVFIAIWRYLVVQATRYELTTERLRLASGVLSRSVNDVELYRVRDTTFRQSFVERLLGLATIEVAAADLDAPRILLAGLPHATAWELREAMRLHTERRRDAKGVRAIEAG